MNKHLMAALVPLLGWTTILHAEETETPNIETMTVTLQPGFAAIADNNDGKVPLLDMIRAVRPLGFGAQAEEDSAGPSSRGRGGRGNRGGRGMSGPGGGDAEADSGRAGRGRGGFDPVERFQSFDQDGDGLLKGSEINARLTGSKYAEDGAVNLDEFKAAFEEMRAQMAAGGGHSHGGGGHGGGGHNHGGSGRGGSSFTTSEDAALLVSFDANRDRIIEPSEVKAALAKEVARLTQDRLKLDANGDGQITKAEFADQVETSDEASRDEDGFDRRTRMQFNRQDTDHDGVISKAEISDTVLQETNVRVTALGYCLLIAQADTNGDKQLSAGEIPADAPAELKEVLNLAGDDTLPQSAFYGTVRRRLARR